MGENSALRNSLKRASTMFAIIGGVGLIVSFIGWFLTFDKNQFYQSYLVGFVFWLQISVGCLLVLMIHHLAGGRWSAAIQRVLESATSVFPWLGLLFLPIVASIFIGDSTANALYEWVLPEIVANDEILQFKQPYLNVPFFLARAIFYFLVWSLFSYFLSKSSAELDETGDASLKSRLKTISGPGLVLFGLTVSFASFDWMMSIEPHWFSTMYGFMFVTGSGNSAFAFLILVVLMLMNSEPFSEVIGKRQVNDYAHFLFGAIMTWGYAHLCQGLITWSGDIGEFTTWYVARTTNGWEYVYIFLGLFHFAIPFFLLLFMPIKQNIRILSVIAGMLLLVRVVDIFFMLAPAHIFHHHGIPTQWIWMDIASLVGIGGMWLFFFTRSLASKTSFIPLKDPNVKLVQEQLTHGGHTAPSHS